MAAANPLPPGNDGLPLLGETLAFASNPFGFIHQRHARFGDVFRTNILGSQTVFFVGPTLAETYLDPTKIERKGAMPANLTALFGGNPDIVPLLDGEAHARRKRTLLAAFSRGAVAAYLPGLQSRIETLIAKWLAKGEGPVTDDLKTLAIESLAGAILGLEPGEELTRLLADNAILGSAFVALPINLPGTAYSNGLKARDRILALLERSLSAILIRRPLSPTVSRASSPRQGKQARRSTRKPPRAKCTTSSSRARSSTLNWRRHCARSRARGGARTPAHGGAG
jgi:retinoid hydroxylase